MKIPAEIQDTYMIVSLCAQIRQVCIQLVSAEKCKTIIQITLPRLIFDKNYNQKALHLNYIISGSTAYIVKNFRYFLLSQVFFHPVFFLNYKILFALLMMILVKLLRLHFSTPLFLRHCYDLRALCTAKIQFGKAKLDLLIFFFFYVFF